MYLSKAAWSFDFGNQGLSLNIVNQSKLLIPWNEYFWSWMAAKKCDSFDPKFESKG
jgi:hypothetical protein